MISRRKLIKGLAAAAAGGLAAGFYTWRLEPEWLQVVSRDLPVRDLPVHLEGTTLLHVSDLHIGPRVDDAYIARTLATATALGPDFVVMTGDWITYRGPAQYAQLSRLLEGFPRGRLGTVGVLGNHDYGFGWRMAEVGDKVSRIARDAGVQVLRNETVSIAGLQFLGFDDIWGPNFVPARVNRELPGAKLALCHNPDSADRPIWGSYQGWILAGHTHGGQCRPPFLPAPILPVQNKRYSSGVVAVDAMKNLYINRGIGYLIRVRFKVRPELTLFRLKRDRLVVA
jgi:predicted MPP superfamily phosphohydrolase